MQEVEWQSNAPNIMSNQDVYVESEYVELDEHYESLERDEITDKEDGQLSLITEDCESTGILESTSSSDESESETKVVHLMKTPSFINQCSLYYYKPNLSMHKCYKYMIL